MPATTRGRRTAAAAGAAGPPRRDAEDGDDGPPLGFAEDGEDGAWVKADAADTHHLDAALFPKLFKACEMVKDVSLNRWVTGALDTVLYDRGVGVLTKVSRIAIIEYTMVCRGERSRVQAKVWIPGRPDCALTLSVAMVGAVAVTPNPDGATMTVRWSGPSGGSPAAAIAAADSLLAHRVVRALDEANAAAKAVE